ncbi:MAG TPA: patatin-like phospholipase family protein [Anaeromyxobacteraceae bacterium]|nr:patatin-like phospholipase family protein [Anaeromyxobacteraceae bacterium]
MRTLAMAVTAVAALSAGCAHWPVNAPLEKADPAAGYRLANVRRPGQSEELLVFLAFSGGGTRAAALSYGVLEELARTEVTVGGERRRLLDEVDVISAVSGGTFTATYYALRGDRIFQEFEGKFLKRDVEHDLTWRILSPGNWFRLPSGTFSRSDVAAELYDETVFDRATYADLLRGGGPFVIVNGADVTTGARFPFTQDQFDAICSDLTAVPVARAVATSSALPPLLTPITLQNRAGTCGWTPPAWAPETPRGDVLGRAGLRGRELLSYADAAARPYLHLFDGGLAENLGLRSVIEALDLVASRDPSPALDRLRAAKKLVVIVVNAHRDPERDWDRSPEPPGKGDLEDQMWSIPVDRYSAEAVEAAHDQVTRWAAAAPGRSAYFAEVSFDRLPDPADRKYFRGVPTSFALKPEQVDRLREAAGKILRASPGFARLVADLGGAAR